MSNSLQYLIMFNRSLETILPELRHFRLLDDFFNEIRRNRTLD
jgi:hypothetical protein